ncbi:glycosyltransferase [Phocaeicola coprophilus]|uniref:glycosyltransferase n=1 Tax=Phocaeicola coprophilus TaxID=387090 RepID=UPI0022E8E50D|nr:glycosyltransferase [Phocaeicola coprophilus]
MKVAFIIYPEVIVSNQSNGIRSQAFTWGDALKKNNIEVEYINNWNNYNWKDFDIIHFFCGGEWIYNLAKRLKKINNNIILSPIIDPECKYNYIKSNIKYQLSSITRNKINFNDNVYTTHKTLSIFKKICTRSNFEKEFIHQVYHIAETKLEIVPLSYSPFIEKETIDLSKKEKFCLHISSIFHKRKNVLSLIEAAKRYKFQLILAGNKGTDLQFEPLKKAISNSSNIQVLGYISEQEKINLYKKAKVFALPSIQEGVGIVALDAACLGCEIAITNINGPKEYYNNMCVETNPYDIDSIGQGIVNLLDDKIKFQPALKNFVIKEYSMQNTVDKLLKIYNSIL